MILLGLYVLLIISGFIYFCFREKKVSDIILGIFGIILLCGMPVWGLGVNVNKYYSKPEPVNVVEVYRNGVSCKQYQDAAHFCDAEDSNSSVFTSIMSSSGEASQKDICIHCRKPFYHHNTLKEHKYYTCIENMNYAMNY